MALERLLNMVEYPKLMAWLRRYDFLRRPGLISRVCRHLDHLPESAVRNNPPALDDLAEFLSLPGVACARFTRNVILTHLQQNQGETEAWLRESFIDSEEAHLRLYQRYFSRPDLTAMPEAWFENLTPFQLYNFLNILNHQQDDLNQLAVLRHCRRHDPGFSEHRAGQLYKAAQCKRQFSLCLQLLAKFPKIVDEKDFIFERLRLYSRIKMTSVVVSEAREALRKQPVDLQLRRLLLENLIRDQRLAEAGEELDEYERQLKKQKKKDWRYWFFRMKLHYYDHNLPAALLAADHGLELNSKDEQLLEARAKILSILGYSKEALEATRALYARKKTEFTRDLLLAHLKHNEMTDENEGARNTLSLIVDLTHCPNPDEHISHYNKALHDYGRKPSALKVAEILFVIRDEPGYVLPRIDTRFKFILVERVFDEVLCSPDFQDITSEWVSFLEYEAHASFFEWLGARPQPGQRAGIIGAGARSILRTEALRHFQHFFQARVSRQTQHFFQAVTVSALLQALNEQIFTVSDSDDRAPLNTKKVLFITPRGLAQFGGAEEFVQSISDTLKNDFGASIEFIALNTEDETISQEAHYTGANAEALRSVVYSTNPDLIWTLTINNMACIYDALKYHRAISVMGLHFYRALFLPEISDEYSSLEKTVPRVSFQEAMGTSDVVYSNSIYLQRIVADKFNTALPVLHSLPHKYEADFSNMEERKYVLVVNTNAQKGFYLVVEMAKRLPHIPFVALSNQSSSEEATEYCQREGVSNVTVRPYQTDMEMMYRQARVVLVPSYKFIETFSRVCVEAQMLGVPVIGSDVGNVPYILKDSGIVLPEDAAAWADEIQRLYDNNDYYSEKSHQAFENATSRYSFSQQRGKVQRILNYGRKRILLGLGSGIGNMILASPLIKKLHRHFDAPIDIMMADVPKKAVMLFANAPEVNAVYWGEQVVSQRHYDLVYLSRCCSEPLLYTAFDAGRVYRTRDLYNFIDYRSIHETEVELRALEHYLGIPYEDADIFDYCICGNPYPPPKQPGRIGIHAGSKGGHWKKKQWPHFADFAAIMQSQGFEVASLGTSDEYVHGTVNLTTTDTYEMIDHLSTCEYFVGNDSGVSHMAKALGLPGTVLFGPTFCNKMVPYGPGWTVLHGAEDCVPCLFSPEIIAAPVCPNENGLCIDKITVEAVVESVLNTRRHGCAG